MDHELDQAEDPRGCDRAPHSHSACGRSEPFDRNSSRVGRVEPTEAGRTPARGLYEAATGAGYPVDPQERIVRSLIDLHKECVRLGMLLAALGDEEGAKRIEHMLSHVPGLDTGYPDTPAADLAAFERYARHRET